MAFAVGFFTLGRKLVGPNNSKMFFLFCCFEAKLGVRPYGLCGGFFTRGRKKGPNNSEDFIFVVLFRGRAWRLWPLRLGSSRVGASRLPRIIRKILFLLCCFVAGLGLFPMAFAVGFFVLGRNPAGPIHSEDSSFVVLFRCRAWLVLLWPLRLCLGGVLRAWAQTGGPELFGRFYFCFAVSWPGLACAPMAFAAGF